MCSRHFNRLKVQPTSNYEILDDCNTKNSNKNFNQSIDNTVLGYVEIEKLNLKIDLYKAVGTGITQTSETDNATKKDYESMKKGVIYVPTVNAIFGHNLRQGHEMFTDLYKLELGDKVTLHILNNNNILQTTHYIIKSKKVISMKDVESLTTTQYPKSLSLVTCCDKGKRRLLITLNILNN